jgi:large subunit ribosomal protein L10
MPSKINVYMLDELRSRLADVEHCVVVTYTGLTSAEMTDLRAAVRKENGSLMVVKNTLATRALRDLGRDEKFIAMMDGPIAIAYSPEPGSLVRSMTEWDRKRKKLQIIGGMLGGQAIAKQAVAGLATMPALPQMRAIALGAITAPLTSFLSVCNEVIRSFMRVTDEIAKKQGSAGGAEAAAPAAPETPPAAPAAQAQA